MAARSRCTNCLAAPRSRQPQDHRSGCRTSIHRLYGPKSGLHVSGLERWAHRNENQLQGRPKCRHGRPIGEVVGVLGTDDVNFCQPLRRMLCCGRRGCGRLRHRYRCVRRPHRAGRSCCPNCRRRGSRCGCGARCRDCRGTGRSGCDQRGGR